MSFAQDKALDDAYVMPTFGRYPVEFVSGRGMTLVDSTGKTYTDFLGGIAVCSLGHSAPVVTKALAEQAEKLVHVSNYFYIEHRGQVARRLSRLANATVAADGSVTVPPEADPADDASPVWKTFFANSGAEANECAMKLARLWSRRSGNGGNTIVALRQGFHGRTLETVAATMQERLQKEFRPLPEGFVAATPNDEAELESLFAERGDQICAVMLEPIQGESGVHPLNPSYLRLIRRLTTQNRALMICDEVQCGVFRAGAPFAFQLAGVTPDIFTLAKGVAGGIPMGACVASAPIADTYRPGEHGSTFGGSNLACAVADAVLAELEQGRYAEHAAEVGSYLMERLATVPHVTGVRGAGLMVGCDLDDSAPDAHDLVASALEAGYVLNATGPHTLRLLPPLVCEREHVDGLVAALTGLLG